MSRNIRRITREIDTSFSPSMDNINPYNTITRSVPKSVCITPYSVMPYDTRLCIIEELLKKIQCQINEIDEKICDQAKDICKLKEVAVDHSCKIDYLKTVTCEHEEKLNVLYCKVCELDKTSCEHTQKIECLETNDCKQDTEIKELKYKSCEHEGKLELLKEAVCEINKKLDILKCIDCEQNKKIEDIECQLDKSCNTKKCSDTTTNVNPPVVFEGYTVIEKNTSCGCFWFLIPNLGCSNVVYRFSYKKELCSYVYEPVNCTDYSTVYSPSPSHPTFVYTKLNSCYVLYQYGFSGQISYPLTILGYKYGQFVMPNGSITYGFTPTQQMYSGLNLDNCNVTNIPCDPYNSTNNLAINQCNPNYCPTPLPIYNPSCTPQIQCNKTYQFNFTPIYENVDNTNYKYAVNINSYDPNVFNYPATITLNGGSGSFAYNVIPLENNLGVGISLPFDASNYRISFTAQLRINTSNNYIDYLTGSGSSDAVTPLVILQTYFKTANSTITEQNNNQILFDWDTICTDGSSSTPPDNFVITEDSVVPLQNSEHYKSCINQEVIADVDYPQGTLNECGIPYGQRIITFATTSGFSIVSVTAKIIRKYN